jgi:hypothetical protein
MVKTAQLQQRDGRGAPRRTGEQRETTSCSPSFRTSLLDVGGSRCAARHRFSAHLDFRHDRASR